MRLAYHRQNKASFLDALVRVFQHFGGVLRCVIFDNDKIAVKDGFGVHARKQAGYAVLAAHYGFEEVFRNPALRKRKGSCRRSGRLYLTQYLRTGSQNMQRGRSEPNAVGEVPQLSVPPDPRQRSLRWCNVCAGKNPFVPTSRLSL